MPPILTVELSKPELLTPGYFFFGSYQSDQDGPLMYDNNGVSSLLRNAPRTSTDPKYRI
jgi:hypothetical protein